MANPTATLTALLRSASIDDHEEVLKAANAALKSSKTDENALHTRAVALLKLDRFDDALRALDDGGDKLAQRCVLERAYALYKLGRLEEAEEALSKAKSGQNRGLKHVAAQIAYRSEKFEDAAKLYHELLSDEAPIEGEENDLRINSLAVAAQMEWQGNGEAVEPAQKKHSREDLEAFETAYNAACGSIARGELGAGFTLLKRARDLCEALDDLSDEDKKAEVLPILVQQAYVLTRMGKLEEAQKIQSMINSEEVPEPPTKVIAKNNSLALAPNDNPYLTLRVFETLPTVSNADKHFTYQADILQRNKYVSDLQAMKFPGVAKSTAKIISEGSTSVNSSTTGLSVLNSAAHAQNEAGKVGLKRLLGLLEKRPTDVGLILTIIQLYVLLNKPGHAINLLESFFKRLEESSASSDQDVRFAPGLVALAVSLYRSQGRKAPIKTELAKAAAYWRRKSKAPKSLLRAAGIELLDSTKTEDLAAAGEIFEGLRKDDSKDPIATAGLVASRAGSNVESIQEDAENLSSIESLIKGVDADALEAAGVASLPASTLSAGQKRAGTSGDKEKPAKKRVRKNRMPKDFVEGKVMDPERWLPLRDRSSYRPKGKKGKKKADIMQGGVVKDEESLELVGGAGAVKVEKTAGGGSGNKGKKKKGKR